QTCALPIDLAGCDQSGCRESFQPVPGEVRGKICGSLRLPPQGPGAAAFVLRLSSRALGSFADDQPDRIDLRNHQASPPEDQREWDAANEPGDDVQACSISLEEMRSEERRVGKD